MGTPTQINTFTCTTFMEGLSWTDDWDIYYITSEGDSEDVLEAVESFVRFHEPLHFLLRLH